MTLTPKYAEPKPDRFSMIRIYRGTNGERVVHQRGLTWEECADGERFPLGLLRDNQGEYQFSTVLTECLK